MTLNKLEKGVVVVFLSGQEKRLGRIVECDKEILVSDYFGKPFEKINKNDIISIIGKDWGSVIVKFHDMLPVLMALEEYKQALSFDAWGYEVDDAHDSLIKKIKERKIL